MKKNNVLFMFLASASFLVGINGMAAEVLASDEKELIASTLIEITIKNESSFQVSYTQVDELGDLFFISSENRVLSKAWQWAKNWGNGDTHSLQPGQEIKFCIDKTKMLAFYVIDTTRIVNNLKKGAVVVSSASATFVASVNGALMTAATSACTAKKTFSEMQMPGDRISCKEIATDSVIMLLDAPTKFDSDSVDAENHDDKQQEQSNCGIIIKIQSPETK